MKIAVFGGTFNPIHKAHLLLAERLICKEGLDRFIFVPAGNPPLKNNKKDMASAEDRLSMLALALKDKPFFDFSDIELKRRGPSYTFDTLKFMLDLYSGDELVFVLGLDAMLSIKLWHRWEELLSLLPFWVINRAGDSFESLKELLPEYSLVEDSFFYPGRPEIKKIDLDLPAISSTKIRKCFALGKSPAAFLPEAVYDYISSRGLYLYGS